jgi:hypothetical protein
MYTGVTLAAARRAILAPLPLASRDLNERLQALFEAELERPA